MIFYRQRQVFAAVLVLSTYRWVCALPDEKAVVANADGSLEPDETRHGRQLLRKIVSVPGIGMAATVTSVGGVSLAGSSSANALSEQSQATKEKSPNDPQSQPAASSDNSAGSGGTWAWVESFVSSDKSSSDSQSKPTESQSKPQESSQNQPRVSDRWSEFPKVGDHLPPPVSPEGESREKKEDGDDLAITRQKRVAFARYVSSPHHLTLNECQSMQHQLGLCQKQSVQSAFCQTLQRTFSGPHHVCQDLPATLAVGEKQDKEQRLASKRKEVDYLRLAERALKQKADEREAELAREVASL